MLVPCRECTTQISSYARACPHCGLPLAPTEREISDATAALNSANYRLRLDCEDAGQKIRQFLSDVVEPESGSTFLSTDGLSELAAESKRLLQDCLTPIICHFLREDQRTRPGDPAAPPFCNHVDIENFRRSLQALKKAVERLMLIVKELVAETNEEYSDAKNLKGKRRRETMVACKRKSEAWSGLARQLASFHSEASQISDRFSFVVTRIQSYDRETTRYSALISLKD